MNIQLAEEYRNAEKGGNGAWVFRQSEPGLERGRTLGAGEDMTQGDSCDVHAKTEKER